MALTQEQVNQFALEQSGTGFGMKAYNRLIELGATNRQLVEIAMNASIIGDVAKQNLLANYDVGTGFGQKRNEELLRLGATREQIIDIASNAPVIGDRMIEEYPELEKVDYNIRHANLKRQLQSQYETLVEAEPKAAYGGRQSDIDKIFFNQAKKLADKGVGDLAELTERVDENGNRFVINRNTGEDLFKINRDSDTGVNKWGDVFSGIKDGANFGIEFDPEGRAVLFPVHEKTKGLAQQLVGRDLAKLVTPIATVAGAIYGGPIGAAAGSAGGQLATSGKIDPLQVALAAGATYAGQSLFGGAEAANLSDTTLGMTGADAGFAVAEGAGGGLFGDASFLATDAAGQAAQGLSANQISANLVATGADPASAQLAANLATSGSGVAEIANTLASFAPAGTSSLFTGTAADLAAAGISAGGQGVSITPQQLAAIQAGQVAGGTFAEQLANAQALIPAAGAASRLLGGAGDAIKEGAQAVGDLLGGGTAAGGGILSNLLGGGVSDILKTLINSGIDFETASRIADQARSEGKDIITKAQELGQQGQLPQNVIDNLNTLAASTAQQFREAGAAAQVPFTPYTVTTGAGTATMGPGQATATAAGPYAQIQQQAQQQAFNTLAAMNPAQASQTLFGQMQALTEPVQQRQQQQLLGTLGQRGLLGFGQNLPTVGGATRTVNPLLESLLSAQGAERAQQALQATQFGTSEAQRQAALSQALTAQAQGIDQQTLGLLGQAGQFGTAEQALAQANAARQLQATTAGLGLPLSTGLSTAGMQQRGLEFAASAGLRGQQAALPLQLQASLIEAGRTQNLSDLYQSAVNEIFR